MAGKTTAAKPMSKTEILASLSESTGLSKKEVGSVLEGLSGLISKNIGKKGPGLFSIPGLMKIQVIANRPPRQRCVPTRSSRAK